MFDTNSYSVPTTTFINVTHAVPGTGQSSLRRRHRLVARHRLTVGSSPSVASEPRGDGTPLVWDGAVHGRCRRSRRPWGVVSGGS